MIDVLLCEDGTKPAGFYEQLRDRGVSHAEAVRQVRARFPDAKTKDVTLNEGDGWIGLAGPDGVELLMRMKSRA